MAEISGRLYFWFWAAIAVSFLKLGFLSLDKTALPQSLSPFTISFFKHSLLTIFCHSSYLALIFRPLSSSHISPKFYVLVLLATFAFLNCRSISFPLDLWQPISYTWIICLTIVNFAIYVNYALRIKFPYDNGTLIKMLLLIVNALVNEQSDTAMITVISFWIGLSILLPRHGGEEIFGAYFTSRSSLFLSDGKTKLNPSLVLLVSSLTSVSWAVISWDENLVNVKNKMLSFLTNTARYAKAGRFSIGMAGSIIFQYFFKLTSLDHVIAFFYLTLAWLAILALLHSCSSDYGVFEFLLANVVLGSASNIASLGFATWLAYAAVVGLYSLRLKLETVSLDVTNQGVHNIKL